jgi:hypothetical protein
MTPKGSDGASEGDRAGIDARRVYERGRQVADEAKVFLSVFEEAVGEAESYLKDQLARRPYLTLAVAAGAGYVLGGGVPSRLTRLVVDVGVRLMAANLVQNAVAATTTATEDPATAS